MFAGLSTLLLIHIWTAVLAIVSGAIVFLMPKGTGAHRRVAYVYVAAMAITTGVVAFVPATILRFGDSGYGFFHLFIVLGMVSSLLGLFGLLRWRRTGEPAWLRMHQVRFVFSYAGLWMAGLAQVMTNPRFGIVGELTPPAFWLVFAASNAGVFAVALFVVQHYLLRGDPRRRYALRPLA